ncbi:MAG TPA: purine-binding chemotaxis protein CheW [Clostridiales bacterium]|nr:purine-binding chemotaxis protein CheW [Clostridiales bacterium]
MDNQQLLLFVLENKTYGIDVLKIESIERVGDITRIPNAPEGIIGVMNLRGNILPVLSLRQKMGLGSIKYDDKMRIIVLDDEINRMGLLVDRVMDVQDVDLNEIYNIDEADDLIQGAIKDQNENLIILLNTANLLNNSNIKEI